MTEWLNTDACQFFIFFITNIVAFTVKLQKEKMYYK